MCSVEKVGIKDYGNWTLLEEVVLDMDHFFLDLDGLDNGSVEFRPLFPVSKSYFSLF